MRWLERGPWDVDADGDGVNDSIWTDIDLPLMTSDEGKLLKLMAAYYVEDLGGRLDVNATGNAHQSDSELGGFTTTPQFSFPRGQNNFLEQGFGFGTADISLRHLFVDTLASPDGTIPARTASQNYMRFISARTLGGPGIASIDDRASRLSERNRVAGFNPAALPGLPFSVFGKTGMGLDLFGNPLLFDNGIVNQVVDDPYEAALLTLPHSDAPITIPEWDAWPVV